MTADDDTVRLAGRSTGSERTAAPADASTGTAGPDSAARRSYPIRTAPAAADRPAVGRRPVPAPDGDEVPVPLGPRLGAVIAVAAAVPAVALTALVLMLTR